MRFRGRVDGEHMAGELASVLGTRALALSRAR